MEQAVLRAAAVPPQQAPQVHEELGRLDFMRYVFGVSTEDKSRAQVMDEVLERYGRALEAHRGDRMVEGIDVTAAMRYDDTAE